MTHNPDSPGAPRNVARAVVTKAGDVFFLSEQNGELPPHSQDGFGLYYHDCRYLDGYRIRFAGTPSNVLVSAANQGSIAQFELTNEQFQLSQRETVAAQTFGVHLERVIDGDQLAVHDVITIDNYDVQRHELPVSLDFESHSGNSAEYRLKLNAGGREQLKISFQLERQKKGQPSVSDSGQSPMRLRMELIARRRHGSPATPRYIRTACN
jgi:hypothetical protein